MSLEIHLYLDETAYFTHTCEQHVEQETLYTYVCKILLLLSLHRLCAASYLSSENVLSLR